MAQRQPLPVAISFSTAVVNGDAFDLQVSFTVPIQPADTDYHAYCLPRDEAAVVAAAAVAAGTLVRSPIAPDLPAGLHSVVFRNIPAGLWQISITSCFRANNDLQAAATSDDISAGNTDTPVVSAWADDEKQVYHLSIYSNRQLKSKRSQIWHWNVQGVFTHPDIGAGRVVPTRFSLGKFLPSDGKQTSTSSDGGIIFDVPYSKVSASVHGLLLPPTESERFQFEVTSENSFGQSVVPPQDQHARSFGRSVDQPFPPAPRAGPALAPANANAAAYRNAGDHDQIDNLYGNSLFRSISSFRDEMAMAASGQAKDFTAYSKAKTDLQSYVELGNVLMSEEKDPSEAVLVQIQNAANLLAAVQGGSRINNLIGTSHQLIQVGTFFAMVTIFAALADVVLIDRFYQYWLQGDLKQYNGDFAFWALRLDAIIIAFAATDILTDVAAAYFFRTTLPSLITSFCLNTGFTLITLGLVGLRIGISSMSGSDAPAELAVLNIIASVSTFLNLVSSGIGTIYKIPSPVTQKAN